LVLELFPYSPRLKAHWAKIEIPDSTDDKYEPALKRLRNRLKASFPIEEFNQYRLALDPDNVLSNNIIEKLFQES
jgi:FAD/FMN-containing dehydrogenase